MATVESVPCAYPDCNESTMGYEAGGVFRRDGTWLCSEHRPKPRDDR